MENGCQYDVATNRENPSMYVYTAGYYDVTLVASNEHCKDTVRYENLLYLASNFEQPAPKPFRLVDEDDIEIGSVMTEENVSVYPVPFKDALNIVCNGEFGYTIISESGVVMGSGNAKDNIVVNTSDLPTGAYLINGGKGDKEVVAKIIKLNSLNGVGIVKFLLFFYICTMSKNNKKRDTKRAIGWVSVVLIVLHLVKIIVSYYKNR